MSLVIKTLFWIFFSLVFLFFIALISLDIASTRRLDTVISTLETTDIETYHTTTVDDLVVAYRTWGDPSNPPIILLHGFLGSSYDYRYLGPKLEENYYIVALDLIGFGHSDKPETFTYTNASHAAFVHRVLETLQIKQYILIGHSMSGDIALRHAALEQTTVTQLVLIAPAGLSGGPPRTLSPFFYDNIFKNYYLQRIGFNSVHHQSEYQTAEYFDPMVYFTAQIPSETLRAFSENTDEQSVTDLFSVIQVPTLIIFGEEDTWISPDNGFIFEESLENATLHLVQDTGHMPMIENLSSWMQILKDFLQ